jgi:hypothetical protein
MFNLPEDGGLALLRGLLAKRPDAELGTVMLFFGLPVAQLVKSLTAEEVMKLMEWRAEIAAGEATRKGHFACVSREFESAIAAHRRRA